ncbi:MAG: hypothetical protein CMJ18_07915 [Phycisphaeraceae bacterium]|nr:hypothetical protein [Phycisphaeraceae bacterium]
MFASALSTLPVLAHADLIETWNDPRDLNHGWQYWAPGISLDTRPGAAGQSQDAAWAATGGVGDSGFISSPDLLVSPPRDDWEALWGRFWPAYQAPPDRVDDVDLTGEAIEISVNDLGTGMAPWIAQNSSLRLFIGEWDAGPTPDPGDDLYVFYEHASDIAVGHGQWIETRFDVGTNDDWTVIEHNYGPSDQDAFDNRPPESLYPSPQQWGFTFASFGITTPPAGGRLGFDDLIIPEPSPLGLLGFGLIIVLLSTWRPHRTHATTGNGEPT